MTDLQTRIREFLYKAYSPDNPLTVRDKLDQAVGLLKIVAAIQSAERRIYQE